MHSPTSFQRAKVLFITQRSPHHQQAALQSAPPELDVTMVRAGAGSQDTIRAHLPHTEFLISERAGIIDGDMIARAPHLRLIQRLGSLTFDIDVADAHAAGVRVCATPVYGSILVAEHMLMQMLALVKRLPSAAATANAAGTPAVSWREPRRTDENTFAYNWSQRHHVGGLYERRIGIVGFGEIGVELARRLQPFRPHRVLYHKRHRLPTGVEEALAIAYTAPGDLYANCDILCNLLPYAPETDGALDAEVFRQLPEGALVVSCGSGSVIDERALAAALADGHLAGAALDTFEWEPLQGDNPLLALARKPEANVLLTPHTAAGTAPLQGRGRRDDFANIMRLLRAEPLQDEVFA